MKVLIVEDDAQLSGSIEKCLRDDNLLVEQVVCGKDALQLLSWNTYDVILLDWNLPDLAGMEVLKRFRSSGGETPVLMLTGMDKTDDKVRGFSAGADDYLTKPFDMPELKARVQALLRRGRAIQEQMLTMGDLTLDTKTCRVLVQKEILQLRPREYRLLEFLMRHPDQYFTSKALHSQLWSSDSETAPDVVRTWVHRLREKLPTGASIPQITFTSGRGYMLRMSVLD